MSVQHRPPREAELPPPAPIFALAAAALLEMETTNPGLIERIRVRLERDSNAVAAVRLRGPKSEPAVREAIEQALAWTGILTVIGEIETPAKRKRKRFWGWA